VGDPAFTDEEFERRRADRVFKALMLAPTLEIGEALLRGERVPLNKLRLAWVKRFGLRR
jgi:hypothetical protein